MSPDQASAACGFSIRSFVASAIPFRSALQDPSSGLTLTSVLGVLGLVADPHMPSSGANPGIYKQLAGVLSQRPLSLQSPWSFPVLGGSPCHHTLLRLHFHLGPSSENTKKGKAVGPPTFGDHSSSHQKGCFSSGPSAPAGPPPLQDCLGAAVQEFRGNSTEGGSSML